MSNSIGNFSQGKRTEEYVQNKYPKYTQEFEGTETDCRTSGSTFYNSYGWDVKLESGNPWTMTATVQAEVGSNNQIIQYGSGSYITVNWGFKYNTTDKELLHCDTSVISWINSITSGDKAALENQLANASGSLNTGAGTGFSTNSTSLAACQVIWTLAKNGQKTMPIRQKILRKTMHVPATFNLLQPNSNIGRTYLKTTAVTEFGIPTNWASIMPQDSDPTSLVTDDGQTINLLYGWQKQAPEQDQDGSTITITQELWYGLYPQNVFGTRL